tara:strand:+ start:407 stop:586 length:180 start_codon:yes stop_codon:yes gene_type:complete
MSEDKFQKLLSQPLQIVNIGLESFAQELRAQNISVTQVNWSPPAGGDPKLAELLSKLGS